MTITAVTQARLGSSRLPNKILQRLGSKTALDLHLQRVKNSKLIQKFIVASTFEKGVEPLGVIAKSHGFAFFQGDTFDVLDRFYQACRQQKPDLVMRLTSDCPLIDPIYLDDLITQFLKSGADYASNAIEPTLPDGMDAEIFKFSALEDAWTNAKKKSEREHVTPYIRDSGKYKVFSVKYPHHWDPLRMTLDTEDDLIFLRELVAKAGEEASLEEYVQCLEKNSELQKLNQRHSRNEGYKKSLSED